MAIISRNEVEELWVTRIGVAPVFIAALLPFIIGVVVLLKCVLNHCCVRKTTTKEELFGVEGRMTILSNTEHPLTTNRTTTRVTNVEPHNNNNSRPCSSISMAPGSVMHDSKKQANQLQQSSLAADTVDGSDSFLETVDLTGSLRAAVKRQLPAPPQSPNHGPRRSSSMLSQDQDGTSELYATVEEVPGIKNPVSNDTREHLYAKVIKPKLAKGKSLGDQPSSSKNTREPNPSSDSETYATSLNNPHHPYAKLKRPHSIDHPYAKVGASNRARTESTETAGDDAEETDTDNYDVAHPYALINKARTDQSQGSRRSTHNGEVGSESNTASNNEPSTSAQSNRRGSPEPNQADENVPVPPRRIGRQWRRGSNPQPNAADNSENQATFSGDSQDSRGYSHLSVREPLSTIKAQTRKPSDPNYAFVSDDSEEMYAAIDDPSDANYMSIDRPSRLGPTSLISPIPERREANSPLPPPPLVSSPLAVPPAESPLATNSSSGPAIYAQVTKRKKNKAPPTPSTDTNGQSHAAAQLGADTPSKPKQKVDMNNVVASTSAAAQLGHAESEPRRWSKADISYSEFEVIRESIFPPTSGASHSQVKHKSFNGENYASIGADALLDEDNYNIIPEPRGRSQIPKQSVERHSARHESMYQEIDEVGPHRGKYPYQEIPHRSSTSTSDDHYHGIGSNRRRKRNKSNEKKAENNPSSSYQRGNPKTTEGEDSDDEDEDGFYEKVKSKPRPQDKHTNSNTAGTDKKHGYEKLKRKPNESKVNANISDDDDDGFYEKVKCPPKAPPQQQDHPSHSATSHHKNSESKTNLPPSSKESVHGAKSTVTHNHSHGAASGRSDDDVHNAEVDQLYARVDKTRKKRPEQNATASEGKSQPAAAAFEPPTPTSKAHAHSSKGHGTAGSSGSGERRNEPILTLTKDVTIEYI